MLCETESPPLAQKRCSKCGVLKPLTAFTTDKRNCDGRVARCKVCSTAHVKAYYAKHPRKRRTAPPEILPPGQKRCSKCHAVKPLTAFTYHKRSRDGRHSSCKVCGNAQTKAYNAAHPEKARATARRSYRKHRAKALAGFKDWAARHPFAGNARGYVQKAVKIGRLVMPDTCDRCGRFLDGQYNCHHADYSRPLSVTTLCASCHRLHHYAEARDV